MNKSKGQAVFRFPICGLSLWLFVGALFLQAPGQGALANPPLTAPGALAEATPLGADGSTTTFRYWRSSSESNAYLVQPIGNTGFTFQVSESYLGLVVNSPPIDDKMRLSVLIQYPFYMDQLYQSRVQTSYPDAQRSYDAPFAPFAIENLQITQDNMASPYVRVRITEPGSPSMEFSVNRAVVDQLLSDGSAVGTNLIAALRKYSYRLPEEARNNFASLSSTQLMALAAKTLPSVAGQEFVRARTWYAGSTNVRPSQLETPTESLDATESASLREARVAREKMPDSALTPRPAGQPATETPASAEQEETQQKGPIIALLALLAAVIAGIYFWFVHRQS